MIIVYVITCYTCDLLKICYLRLCLQTPRSEALSLIGSLMCFPNHYQDLQVLNVGQLSVESLSSNTLKVSTYSTDRHIRLYISTKAQLS